MKKWTYTGNEDGDFVIWDNEVFVANVGSAPFVQLPPAQVAFDVDKAHAELIVTAVNEYLKCGTSSVASQGPQPVAESLSTLWDGNSLPLSPGEKIAYRGIAQTVWDAAQKSQAAEIERLQQRNEAITWACEQREKLQEAAEAEIAGLRRELEELQN